MFDEPEPCKKDTFRDCLQVEMLGKDDGLYNFQIDIGTKPFKAHCEWRMPTAECHAQHVQGAGSWGQDPINRHCTFIRRLLLFEITCI